MDQGGKYVLHQTKDCIHPYKESANSADELIHCGITSAMETPVGEHIRKLEDRLMTLNMLVMQNRKSLPERNEIEAEIRAVNLAISHYKAALELEKKLSIR